VEIQKTKSNEYIITISKIAKPKSSGFFVCGKSNDNNVKKIANSMLNTDEINEINNRALKKESKNYQMTDFLELNPEGFVKILKSMNIGTN
jgi:hypothetical protein